MADDVTEFLALDPNEMHLVPKGANDFPFLLAKAADDAVHEELVEKAVDGVDVVKACGLLLPDCEICHYASTKGKLNAEARNDLSDGDFAYIDSKGGRHLPIHDAAHVRNALARFNETHFESSEAKASAHRKIVARAKELGIDVAAEKEVSTGESLSQTHEVDAGPGSAASPEAGDGGEPRSVSFPHGAPGDGHGDTAPDKDLHQGEAGSQTAGAQTNKADPTGDGTGGTNVGQGGDTGAPGDTAKAPFVTMDNAAAGASGSADSDPGNPAWEHKDAALADCASHLILRANELITMLGQRERAEKGTPLLTQETEGAIRRSIEGLTKALTDNQTPVSKEEIEMDHDELIKLLDERDEAARQARKAAKAAKKAAQETAAKGEGTETETAEAAEAAKAVEGEDAPTVESLQKELADTKDLVAKMATEDGRRAVLNGAGMAAILRGPDKESVLKSFDVAVEEAEKSGDPDRIRTARFQRTAAKMVAGENARERGELPRSSRFGPNSTELFARTGTLGEDTALRSV